ncbi:MAG: EamA family transporter [Cuniculiplasma sp.]
MIILLLTLPFLALICWTLSNSYIKKTLKFLDSNTLSILVAGPGLIPIFIFIFLDGGIILNPILLPLGVISGILLGSGYLLFYRGLGVESLSGTGVTLNIQQVIVIFISIFFVKETVNGFEYMGIFLIIMGATLVTVQNSPSKRKFLIIAGLANIAWGLYYLPLSESILMVHFSAMPLFIGRLVGFIFVILVSYRGLRKGHPVLKTKFPYAIGLIAGIFDGLGNVFYSFSIQMGIFVISGAIVALIPATLAIIGFSYFKDRMTGLKLAGIIVSVMGAILISLS